MLAAVGVGEFASISEAADAIVRGKSEYAPSGVSYDTAYQRYSKLDELLN